MLSQDNYPGIRGPAHHHNSYLNLNQDMVRVRQLEELQRQQQKQQLQGLMKQQNNNLERGLRAARKWL